MNKTQRHEMILKIIRERDVSNQDELLAILREQGIFITQATISRDIRDLGIKKNNLGNGVFRYTAATVDGAEYSRINHIFKECVKSLDYAQNIVVIQTLPGLASAACSAVDAMGSAKVLGSIAGDDTGLIVLRSTQCAAEFCEELQTLMSARE